MKSSYASKKENWSDRPKCGQVKFGFGEETLCNSDQVATKILIS